MASRVELAFRDAADRRLPDDGHWLAAVSGGADSVALLHLLARLAPRRRWRLTVAHLDHGLRPDSPVDRRFVEGLARALDLPCEADRRPVPERRRPDESPEEAARRVRRAFLLEARERVGADAVVTAHHRDDQAETVLMRLLRGSGPSALVGIHEEGPGPFVRPLLAVGRAALRAWLRRHGLAWREDASNADTALDRNRVRHRLLPLLERSFNARASDHLVRTADRLREDAAYLDRLAARAYGRIRLDDGPTLDAESFRGEDTALLGRIAALALRDAGADPRRVTSRHVRALVDLARGADGRSLDLPGRMRAERRRGRIRLSRNRLLE